MGEDFCRPFCELSASSSYKEGLSVATCRQTPAPHHPATLAPVASLASLGFRTRETGLDRSGFNDEW